MSGAAGRHEEIEEGCDGHKPPLQTGVGSPNCSRVAASLPYHVKRFCRSRGLPSYSVGASVPICRAGRSACPGYRMSTLLTLPHKPVIPNRRRAVRDLANLWGGASCICACDLGRFFAALCRLRMTMRWNAISPESDDAGRNASTVDLELLQFRQGLRSRLKWHRNIW